MEKEKLYVVRLYDGFDNIWMDVSGPLSEDEANKLWLEKTDNGTKMTSYDDIDYFKVFPEDTTMMFSAEAGYRGRD